MLIPRELKRILYGIINLGILVAIVYGIYSAFSEKKVVVSPAPQLAPLRIESSQLLPVGVFDYDLLITILNPNFDFGASDIEYQANILDAQGVTLKSIISNSFIMPGQRKNLIVSPIELNQEPGSVDVKIRKVSWAKLQTFIDPSKLFFVKQQLLKKIGDSTVLDLTLSNISNFNFENVWITIRLDGIGNQSLAVGIRREDTFLSRSDRDIHFVWKNNFVDQTIRISIDAYTNVFQEDNFIKENGGGLEQFQQLF